MGVEASAGQVVNVNTPPNRLKPRLQLHPFTIPTSLASEDASSSPVLPFTSSPVFLFTVHPVQLDTNGIVS